MIKYQIFTYSKRSRSH